MADATATSYLDPNTLAQILQAIQQKRAAGQYVSNNTEQNAYAGALQASESEALKAQALAQQQNEFQQEMALRNKQYSDQRTGSMVTGLFGAGKFGMQGYDWLKNNNMFGLGGSATSNASPAVPSDYNPAVGASPENVAIGVQAGKGAEGFVPNVPYMNSGTAFDPNSSSANTLLSIGTGATDASTQSSLGSWLSSQFGNSAGAATSPALDLSAFGY